MQTDFKNIISFIIRQNKQKWLHLEMKLFLEINKKGSFTCLWHQVLLISDG